MTDATKQPDSDIFTEEEMMELLARTQAAVEWMATVASRLERAVRGKGRVADIAEAYILTKRVNDTLEEGRKVIGQVAQDAAYKILPEKMADEDMTTFTSRTLGFRVTVSSRTSASIIDKEGAFGWLRDNDLGDLIVPTVNAQTLSSQVKRLIEDENKEPPEEFFKVSTAPYTSVTKVKAK